MKTSTKIETYFALIQGIRYENEHGGQYAYVQFLAYSRELLKTLRSYKSVERHAEAIEGISWLFNECLVSSFTPRHKVIFETKQLELSELFEKIRNIIKDKRPSAELYNDSHFSKAA